jgi:hypothetical protein
MTYASELAAVSRTPVALMALELDWCALACGPGASWEASPDAVWTDAGAVWEDAGDDGCGALPADPCYNTWPTCRDRARYSRGTRAYKFTSCGAPLPFKGVRPYVRSVKYLPTEIQADRTVSARCTVVCHDEPDADVGIDPYRHLRSAIQGTFWKKLLARNRNYRGRVVRISEGFAGLAEADFSATFVGRVDNVRLSPDGIEIEVADLLKALSEIEVPAKTDVALAADIDAAAAAVSLNGTEGLASPAGYVRIGDEILAYTGVDVAARQLTGCTRAMFGTAAAAHYAKDNVQACRYYAPANPFDILKEMLLTDAAFDAAWVDADAFDAWRDWPGGEVDFSAVVSEPTELATLYFEIVDLLNCKSWVGEDLKITIRRNMPNRPGRAYATLTDAAHIVADSAEVDLNQDSRISRVSLYWDKTAIGDVDEPASYNRLDMAVDTDAESANEYAEAAEKRIFCRWLRQGYAEETSMARYARTLACRRLWQNRDPMPILKFDVEAKDAGIRTGEYAKISTDELLDECGAPLAGAVFQVVRREKKEAAIALSALQIVDRRACFIAPPGQADYDSATAAEREYGYICAATGRMTNDDGGYVVW